jgi:hypothetical protein
MTERFEFLLLYDSLTPYFSQVATGCVQRDMARPWAQLPPLRQLKTIFRGHRITVSYSLIRYCNNKCMVLRSQFCTELRTKYQVAIGRSYSPLGRQSHTAGYMDNKTS